MKPLVIAIEGPSRGASSILDQPELLVGRDSGNHLLIEDDCVSARHCAIRNEGGIFTLVDLQSRNGTLVNGVAVEEKILVHGDRISIGESVLTFILPSGAGLCSAELVENPRLVRAAVRIRAEGTLYLSPEKVASSSPSIRREKDLHTLLTIASRIATIRDTESLQWQLLGMVFDAIPAERAAFLLLGNDPTEFKSSVSWNRKAGPDKPVKVSRELVRQVIADRAGLLLHPAEGESDTTGRDSQIVSVMCVPLQAVDGVLGAIYVETDNPDASFDAQHLELLSAIAGIAALALSTLSFMDALVGEN
ncbi:MAG TPA: FHA domain-containing protein, partial [Candidatus Sulfotelmatobacter sp.]